MNINDSYAFEVLQRYMEMMILKLNETEVLLLQLLVGFVGGGSILLEVSKVRTGVTKFMSKYFIHDLQNRIDQNLICFILTLVSQ